MKKFLAILLICSLAFGMLTACGGEENDNPQQGTTPGTNESNSSSGSSDIVETGGSLTYTIPSEGVADAGKVDIGSLYVTDSMLDMGISRAGSTQRLAAVMEKAAYGETITVAYIGGSIAAGRGASSYEKSYAALTTAWLQAAFPSATVQEVNIGSINGDSYLAAHRIADEVVPKNPDIVIIDTASEDVNAISQEAFESMVRVLLSSGSSPAVIPLITTNSSYKDDGDSQAALAFKLNLPVISYADVLENNITNGTWAWTDVAESGETLNPSDSGHAFIAYLLTGYFQRVLNGIASSQYSEYVLNDSTTTMVRYMNASIVAPDQVPHDGEDNALTDLPNPEDTFVSQGMGTTSGSEATFEVTGKYIGMLYWKSMDGNSGQFDLYVDDEFVTTLDGDLSSVEDATYNYVEFIELGKYSESGTHTVKLVKNEESTADAFYVCGFTISQ